MINKNDYKVQLENCEYNLKIQQLIPLFSNVRDQSILNLFKYLDSHLSELE